MLTASEIEKIKNCGTGDCYLALVDDAGDVAVADRAAFAAAVARGAEIIGLTADEMAYYWPGRASSFCFADLTPVEIETLGRRIAFDNPLLHLKKWVRETTS